MSGKRAKQLKTTAFNKFGNKLFSKPNIFRNIKKLYSSHKINQQLQNI